MEHRPIKATEGGSLIVADPLRWACASVAPDQSARTLGDRPYISMAVSAAMVLTSPLAFVAASTLRLAALAETVRTPVHGPTPLRDEDLPTYSVLVPLYREADVVPDLARAMLAMDYPADRLEVLVLLEEGDVGTVEAVRVHMAGVPFRVVVVPDGSPRTKPRACTYGLALCQGARVVVYDSEDRPEPDQLRRAAAALEADPDLAVVQCRLACDHASGASPLVRLWALDYDVLFGALLPTLSHAGLPFLLGGTSNHFRRDALLSVGGWDAHNVTEDADLAVRLARAGWRSGFVDSTTWEEAPLTLGAWVRQRSRWLKGFAITTLVHSRRPVRLLRDLGLRRTLALYAQLPAALLSVAVFPLGAGLVASGSVDAVSPLTWLLVAGNSASWLLALRVACSRRRSPGVGPWLVGLLPAYWLALTWALVVGLAEVPRRRTCWSKTEHGLAARPAGVTEPAGTG
ncbi:glycosyltransferase family 2 protein [Mameliella alba]|uniref:Glycosyl transferase, family 2 n=1 Tax=Mameliella alba TaxID=561184 RepID=A0A0B3SAB1_9RHOB|nr:glycosyltransferase [Mameliella alba]KHQ53606.1 Glycosyl transferase, family 2 [Mameliella alba]